MLYFFAILIIHPIERLIVYLAHKTKILWMKNTWHIQKDLNKLLAGIELDYSYKIGRLMGHLFIVFYLGSGLPLLYCIFWAYLLLYWVIEKLMIVKFYKRMKLKSIYIRQFISQSLWVIFFVSLFRSILILGSEDIFPTTIEAKSGVYSGSTVTYYSPKSRSFGDKMILSTGIPFTILIIVFPILYWFMWWIHKDFRIFKLFKSLAFADVPFNLKLKATDIKKSFKLNKKALKRFRKIQSTNNENLLLKFDYTSALYHPSTYEFSKRSEYKASLKKISFELEKMKKLEQQVAPDHQGIEIFSKFLHI